MRTYRFVQADVFTDRLFGGNPVAVFPHASKLTDEEMHQIAREMNLSETTFVLPPSDPEADVRVRFFTPQMELPFAGHPTIGTHIVLAQEEFYDLEEPVTRIFQEIQIGILPVDLTVKNGEVKRAVMTHGPLSFGDFADDLSEVSRALGLQVDDIDTQAPPRVASTGLPCLMVPIKSRAAVDRVLINMEVFKPMCDRVGVTGVQPFCFEPVRAAHTIYARNFSTPETGLLEDPATGSAGGALGGYLVHHRLVPFEEPTTKLTIEQGYKMNRPGLIEVFVDTNSRDVERIRVGGSAVRVLEGTMTL